MPFHIFGIFEQHVDDVADLYRQLPIRIDELRNRNDTFGFISDIDDHIGIRDLQNHALHYFAFREFAGAILV